MRENSFELFINNTYYLYFSFSDICVYVSLSEARFKMLLFVNFRIAKIQCHWWSPKKVGHWTLNTWNKVAAGFRRIENGYLFDYTFSPVLHAFNISCIVLFFLWQSKEQVEEELLPAAIGSPVLRKGRKGNRSHKSD